jgi:hypothetical protein
MRLSKEQGKPCFNVLIVRTWVQEKLQAMLDNITLSLELDMPVSISLRNRDNSSWTTTEFIPGTRSHRFRTLRKYFTYSDLGCLVRVIEVILEALRNENIVTKR